MDALVYSVQSAKYAIIKVKPPLLWVSANGEVTSTGWSDGRLIPWVYVVPPSDGIQDFSFIATTPSGIVLPVITPITGTGLIELPEWVKGVRVHSSTNNVEALFDDQLSSVESLNISPIGIPQPQ